MNIKFLVQDVSRLNYAIEDDFSNLNELGFDIIPFGVIPFTFDMTGVENLNTEDIYIVRGGTKIISMIEHGAISNISPELLNHLKSGIHHNDNRFDQAFYSKLGLPLLNENPVILNIRDNFNLSFDVDKFVKPSSDMKAFNAGIMTSGTRLKDYIESGLYRSEYDRETILLHDKIRIHSEFRFICIKDKVIAGSRYRQNDRLVVNDQIPVEVLNVADKYVKLYQPDDIYTMDLCETDEGIKIVEYNCWNGAGLYAMDIKKVFKAVYEYYEEKFNPEIKKKNAMKH